MLSVLKDSRTRSYWPDSTPIVSICTFVESVFSLNVTKGSAASELDCLKLIERALVMVSFE